MKSYSVFDPLTGPACGCEECEEAGVATEPTRRDPDTGTMLHGYALKRGLDAFAAFQSAARAACGPKNRPRGMTRLVSREPGEDG